MAHSIAPISLLDVPVRLLKWVGGWFEQLCFLIGDPPRKGKKVALPPIYLGSSYARLDECFANMMGSLGRHDVVSYVDSAFQQLFLWERFETLAPTHIEYSAMISTLQALSSPMGAKNIYRARFMRWAGVK